MKIPEVNINEFDYELPDSRIARYPAGQRDLSKLLIYREGNISEKEFFRLPSVLPKNAAMVFNNSRVICARLLFKKKTGAQIEIFCLEPVEPFDYQKNLQETSSVVWKCFIGNRKKWKHDILTEIIQTGNKETILQAVNIENKQEHSLIKFNWDNKEVSFAEILDVAGKIPIPPYLNRNSEEIDITRYQTIYSTIKGSVAAPTAGLHFTPRIFEELEINGNPYTEFTLHVGAGTFKPVQARHIEDHVMHEEVFSFSIKQLEFILENHENIIAVGTTSTRMLESIYWLGVKILTNENTGFTIEQWAGFILNQDVKVADSVNALINYFKRNNIAETTARTSIMIIPGYKFRIIKGLVTNFHQPRSSLLLLIAAFTGDNWKKIYRYAIENDFRFLSYGDGSILLP